MASPLKGNQIVVLGSSTGSGTPASYSATLRLHLSTSTTSKRSASSYPTIDAPIDHIFVGAGSPLYSRLDDLDVAEARDAVAHSVALILHLAKHAAPIMSAGGTLLFMGGTSARTAAPGMSVINATMGSSTALIKTLALEIAPVRINQIAAGFVDTPLSARLLGEGLEQRRADLRERLHIRRVVTADDVAALALHIMSNTAITGAVFDIDGGQQLLPPIGA